MKKYEEQTCIKSHHFNICSQCCSGK